MRHYFLKVEYNATELIYLRVKNKDENYIKHFLKSNFNERLVEEGKDEILYNQVTEVLGWNYTSNARFI